MPRLRAIVVALGVGDLLAMLVACTTAYDGAPEATDAGGDVTVASDAGSDASPNGDAASDGDGTTRSAEYRATVLADGPLGYWRMGHVENGTVIPDETAAGNSLLLSGSPGFEVDVPGVFDDDRAVRFKGTTGHAVATNSDALELDGSVPFTVECWAKRELDATGDAGGTFQHLVSHVDGFSTSDTLNGYMLYLSNFTSNVFGSHGALDAGGIQSSGPLGAVGEWTHYAMVFDGTNLTLFVDAQPHGSNAVKGPLSPRTAPFTVAKASNETSRHFQGVLDEIAIYPNALGGAAFAKRVSIVRAP